MVLDRAHAASHSLTTGSLETPLGLGEYSPPLHQPRRQRAEAAAWRCDWRSRPACGVAFAWGIRTGRWPEFSGSWRMRQRATHRAGCHARHGQSRGGPGRHIAWPAARGCMGGSAVPGVPLKPLSRGPPSAPMHLRPAALAVEDSREEDMTARRAGFANKTRSRYSRVSRAGKVVNTPTPEGISSLGDALGAVLPAATRRHVSQPRACADAARRAGARALPRRILPAEAARGATGPGWGQDRHPQVRRAMQQSSWAYSMRHAALPAAQHMPMHHNCSGPAAVRNWQEVAQIFAQGALVPPAVLLCFKSTKELARTS